MKRPHALVVDDEPDIRELVEITLRRMDVNTIIAENLEQAYAAAGSLERGHRVRRKITIEVRRFGLRNRIMCRIGINTESIQNNK